MHVIAFLERYIFVESMQPEPYFEGEAVAELGCSFEAAVCASLNLVSQLISTDAGQWWSHCTFSR